MDKEGDRLPATGRSRPRNAARTRTHILDVAADLFATHGFEGTSIHEIAKASGYTIGAIYRHFGSKSLLLLDVVKNSISSIPAISRDDGDGGGGRNALAELIATLMSPRHLQLRMLTVQLHSAALGDPEMGKLLRELNGRRIEEIARLVARARGEGNRRGGASDADRAALLMMLITGTSHVDVVKHDLIDRAGVRERICAMISACMDE